MTERRLKDHRILIIEDEYLLADELAHYLRQEGALVLGPVSNVAAAITMLENEANLDGAVLDINLGGQLAYPVADALMSRGIAFVFTTGMTRRSFRNAWRKFRPARSPSLSTTSLPRWHG